MRNKAVGSRLRWTWRLAAVLLAALFIPCGFSSGESWKAGSPDGEFRALYPQWQKTLIELQVLRKGYALSPASEQAKLEAEAEDLTRQAREQGAKLKELAIASYRAAPGSNPEILDFLKSILGTSLARDDFEQAYEIAELLQEGGTPDKNLNNAATIAAYATHDLPAARKAFEATFKAGTVDQHVLEFFGALQPVDIPPLMDAFEKLWQPEQALREAEAQANDLPRVRIETTKGSMVVELFEDQAPNTVANFITLAEKGFYDGTEFFRVIKKFMAQGGDPENSGSGGPGYTIACECYRPDHRNHFRGSLSMALRGPNTGGSQFFITFRPQESLDGKYTVFGRVIEGFDVLSKLRISEAPGPKDRILKTTVLRKRDHAYTVEKVPDPPQQ